MFWVGGVVFEGTIATVGGHAIEREGGLAPPLPSGPDPGIWRFQPLTLTSEKNKTWSREIARSVGVSE